MVRLNVCKVVMAENPSSGPWRQILGCLFCQSATNFLERKMKATNFRPCFSLRAILHGVYLRPCMVGASHSSKPGGPFPIWRRAARTRYPPSLNPRNASRKWRAGAREVKSLFAPSRLFLCCTSPFVGSILRDACDGRPPGPVRHAGNYPRADASVTGWSMPTGY
jgi:hypothetical protein